MARKPTHSSASAAKAITKTKRIGTIREESVNKNYARLSVHSTRKYKRPFGERDAVRMRDTMKFNVLPIFYKSLADTSD